MKRARIVITPDFLFMLIGLANVRLVGPTNANGNLELTVEHESLPDVPIAEGADAPIVEVICTRREDGSVEGMFR